MRTESWVGAMLGVLVWAAALSAEPAQQCPQSRLPANIEMPRYLTRELQQLHDRSPAFRAQCEQLGLSARAIARPGRGVWWKPKPTGGDERRGVRN